MSEPKRQGPEVAADNDSDAYRRGRSDAANAIQLWSVERRKAFLWVEEAIRLALGGNDTT